MPCFEKTFFRHRTMLVKERPEMAGKPRVALCERIYPAGTLFLRHGERLVQMRAYGLPPFTLSGLGVLHNDTSALTLRCR